jgi:hypothetical protein
MSDRWRDRAPLRDQRTSLDALFAAQMVWEGAKASTAKRIEYANAMIGFGSIPVALIETLALDAERTYSSPDVGPPFLLLSAVRPVVRGMTVADRKLRADGRAALDQMIADPPRSACLLLHPERNPSNPPLDVRLPAASAAVIPGWRVALTDVFGEMLLLNLLDRNGANAKSEEAAKGWDGDRVVVFARDGADPLTASVDKMALGWVMMWETVADAEEAAAPLATFLGELAATAAGGADMVLSTTDKLANGGVRMDWFALPPEPALPVQFRLERSRKKIRLLVNAPDGVAEQMWGTLAAPQASRAMPAAVPPFGGDG